MQNREILRSIRSIEIGDIRQLGQLSVFWGGITTRRITLLLLSDKIKKGVITKNMLVSRLSDAYSVDVTTEGIGLCPLPPVIASVKPRRAKGSYRFAL